MKKQTPPQKRDKLSLNKTAISNLTLTPRQMAAIEGGRFEGNPVVSDLEELDNPCTARPTLISLTKCTS